ncbi:BTB/POZ domain-containing protein 3-like [Perca flavescens]|uniref:BTB/POZ domain-containing protein 3-like n=1 Tax=Perca flavescens TaxID=8167 RepID=UPI00106DEB61|nr:BTB/POZ domain-containing protein 3-like [Perca flavescens]
MAQRVIKYFSDGSSSTFPVSFDYPVQIEPDTASLVLDGNELSYFGQEGMTEVQYGKVTFQFQCSSDSTNGTGVQGGQIPELIFYA